MNERKKHDKYFKLCVQQYDTRRNHVPLKSIVPIIQLLALNGNLI